MHGLGDANGGTLCRRRSSRGYGGTRCFPSRRSSLGLIFSARGPAHLLESNCVTHTLHIIDGMPSPYQSNGVSWRRPSDSRVQSTYPSRPPVETTENFPINIMRSVDICVKGGSDRHLRVELKGRIRWVEKRPRCSCRGVVQIALNASAEIK